MGDQGNIASGCSAWQVFSSFIRCQFKACVWFPAEKRNIIGAWISEGGRPRNNAVGGRKGGRRDESEMGEGDAGGGKTNVRMQVEEARQRTDEVKKC